MAKTKPEKEPTYGEAAARLEEILQKIEEGQVDIDELSGLVREAAGLVSLCREKIHAAEVQVRTITEKLEREAPGETGDGSEGTETGSGEEPPF
jgi:exodeoxyribonuclease VII small subunit